MMGNDKIVITKSETETSPPKIKSAPVQISIPQIKADAISVFHSRQRAAGYRKSAGIAAAVIGTLLVVFILWLALKPKSTDMTGHPLEIGREYWLSISSASVNNVDNNGSPWDTDGSAPDIYWELKWNGTKIYTSPVCDDALLPSWKSQNLEAAVDIFKLSITPEMKQAGGVFRYQPDENIDIVFWDEDLVGGLGKKIGANDMVGGCRLHLSDLKVGINKIQAKGGPLSQINIIIIPATQFEKQ